MADFSALKKKTRLGEPPKVSDVKNNLQQPETYEVADNYIDGRTLRKTGRTHQLSTRVRYDFYKKVKGLAFEHDITIAELLEKSIECFQKERK